LLSASPTPRPGMRTPSQCNTDSFNFYLPSSISSPQRPQLCTPNLFTSCVHCRCAALLPCHWSIKPSVNCFSFL
ncbi:hypothetical protein B0H19DRAFT_1200812, partial [Mycena capillaripes]